jgi:outer membrane protein OmpA-like peptidoglycan-associated protein
MAHRRFTPWPAYVDLFSALGVIFIVGWMTASGNFDTLWRENERFKSSQRLMTLAQAQATDLLQQVGDTHAFGNIAVQPCDAVLRDAVCFDIQLEFDLDSDRIKREGDRQRLASLARALRQWFDEPDPARREARRSLQIVIEGHTDSTQPKNTMNARSLFKYNWDLSARRASAVMYELHAAGLNKDEYNLIAWGRADTDPRCSDATERCLERNRRTTIKVRFDSAPANKNANGR